MSHVHTWEGREGWLPRFHNKGQLVAGREGQRDILVQCVGSHMKRKMGLHLYLHLTGQKRQPHCLHNVDLGWRGEQERYLCVYVLLVETMEEYKLG